MKVPPPQSGVRTRWALGAILLVAAVLRLYAIDQPLVGAFSWRQASTAMMAENFYLTNWNIFFPEVNWTGPGPNYQGREFQTVSYLAALGYALVGQHDWIGRLVAIAFGLWGIFALFQLVRLVWDEERALLAALILAVLPGSIFIDRSFLPDPAMVALVTTSVWLWVLHLQTGEMRWLWAAGLVGAWGFASKLPGVIIGLPMAYAAWSIIGPRRLLHRPAAGRLLLFAALTLLPVSAYYLWARHLSLSYPPYHFAGEGNWVWDHGLGNWLASGYYLPKLGRVFLGWFWAAPAALLVVAGLLLEPPHQGAAPADSGARRRPRWLFHWWVAAVFVFYLIGAKELVDNPWNFHIISPAAAALAAHAVWTLARAAAPAASRVRYGVIALLVSAIFLFGARGLRWMYVPYAQQSHELGLALRDLSGPGDLAVTIANDVGDPTLLYYSGLRGWIFPPARAGRAWSELPRTDAEAVATLDTLRYGGAKWFATVREQAGIQATHPGFAAHLSDVSERVIHTPAGTIYQLRRVEVPGDSTAARPPQTAPRAGRAGGGG